jgi:predicted phosphodiesterase
VLDALAPRAPVVAVRGNNDVTLDDLPDERIVDVDGWRIALVHDSGPATGRAARLHRRFPDAHAVVFGHSHIPWSAIGVDGQRLCNPGSAVQRRRQPERTLGWLRAGTGVLDWSVVSAEPPQPPGPPQAPGDQRSAQAARDLHRHGGDLAHHRPGA